MAGRASARVTRQAPARIDRLAGHWVSGSYLTMESITPQLPRTRTNYRAAV